MNKIKFPLDDFNNGISDYDLNNADMLKTVINFYKCGEFSKGLYDYYYKISDAQDCHNMADNLLNKKISSCKTINICVTGVLLNTNIADYSINKIYNSFEIGADIKKNQNFFIKDIKSNPNIRFKAIFVTIDVMNTPELIKAYNIAKKNEKIIQQFESGYAHTTMLLLDKKEKIVYYFNTGGTDIIDNVILKYIDNEIKELEILYPEMEIKFINNSSSIIQLGETCLLYSLFLLYLYMKNLDILEKKNNTINNYLASVHQYGKGYLVSIFIMKIIKFYINNKYEHTPPKDNIDNYKIYIEEYKNDILDILRIYNSTQSMDSDVSNENTDTNKNRFLNTDTETNKNRFLNTDTNKNTDIYNSTQSMGSDSPVSNMNKGNNCIIC
jgi:hypothetical protein